MNQLIIGDLHLPYEHPKALDFCKRLVKEYKIPKNGIYQVGDMTDQYWGSQYQKDPDSLTGARGEYIECAEHVKPWADAFPLMKISEGNHCVRWARMFVGAGIPSGFMRRYGDLIGAPATWHWKRDWIVEEKHKYMVTHGTRFGAKGLSNAAFIEGMSVVWGHQHSIGGIQHIRTSQRQLWSAATSCLIDIESYVYAYGKDNKLQPVLGSIVVTDEGSNPIYIPYS